MTEKDLLFSTGDQAAGTFVFDERVVRVFPDMIARSVPGYELVVPMTGLLARRYAQDGSRLFDLGCSLGASTLAMRNAVRAKDVNITAIDASPAMVNACRSSLAADSGLIPVEVIESDIRDVVIENASVVVMNFTLQFVEREDRAALLRACYQGMREGGVLILSEKIRFDSQWTQEQQTAWHEDFKRARGYSELEIAGKRSALENVLRADTETQHGQRLRQAGFGNVERWFQCFSFCSYIAVR
jgi:tRNA (cmo5U34)-methyltransferase